MILRGDFHIHSCLSPCADLAMTPNEIGKRLQNAQVDWVSITDHNSCENLLVFEKVLNNYGIALLPGIEVQTKEEVHVLIYLKDIAVAQKFSNEIGKHLPQRKNDPERFGYQLLVNENDEFIGMENKLLSTSTDLSIDELWNLSRRYDALFVYAHPDRRFGIIRQLGFIPEKPQFDAIEIFESGKMKMEKATLKSSDAHFLFQIEKPSVKIKVDAPTFEEFKKALFTKEVWML
jgi:PHP family Zn ribbon phosphoesterase